MCPGFPTPPCPGFTSTTRSTSPAPTARGTPGRGPPSPPTPASCTPWTISTPSPPAWWSPRRRARAHGRSLSLRALVACPTPHAARHRLALAHPPLLPRTRTRPLPLFRRNNVFDASLYAQATSQAALSWQRARVANLLARSGAEWAELIARANSGTYNNQWIVVDLKRFAPGHELRPGTLTIVEQTPGARLPRRKAEASACVVGWRGMADSCRRDSRPDAQRARKPALPPAARPHRTARRRPRRGGGPHTGPGARRVALLQRALLRERVQPQRVPPGGRRAPVRLRACCHLGAPPPTAAVSCTSRPCARLLYRHSPCDAAAATTHAPKTGRLGRRTPTLLRASPTSWRRAPRSSAATPARWRTWRG